MARPRGSKNKPKGDAQARSIETIDDDAQRVLLSQHRTAYETALAAKKQADARFKNACKLAKAELGKQAVAQIKIAIELSTPEGEAAVRERVKAISQVARWAGVKLGTQADMFGAAPETPVGQAYNEGKSVGIEGQPAKSPYAPGTEQYDAWLNGHADGNSALLAGGIKPLDNPHSSKPAGDDDDGDADTKGMPREQWRENMRQQNDEAERMMKGGSIGDAKPSLETRSAH